MQFLATCVAFHPPQGLSEQETLVGVVERMLDWKLIPAKNAIGMPGSTVIIDQEDKVGIMVFPPDSRAGHICYSGEARLIDSGEERFFTIDLSDGWRCELYLLQ
ncbi:MAG: hypothetical protein PHO20_01935 [Candidatus Peribacteraceae bacterium]|nr:hypothetical protein [Candidatus Peribacteraceae bacterium]MDD5739504.1 hypothetical protein [Candidatus Peribacteraceae bacterium]